MTHPDVNKLIEQIGQHQELYQKLAEVLDLEQKSLIQFNLDSLSAIGRSKGTIVACIQESVDRLAKKIRAMAEGLGLAGDPLPTLDQLAQSLGEPEAGRLRRAGQSLSRTKRDALQHNRDNQNYVTEALGFVEDYLTVIRDAVQAPSNRYLPTGVVASGTPQALKLNRNV